MAITGALIVFSGLAVLSLAISKLHNLLDLFEKKSSNGDLAPVSEAPPAPGAAPAEPDGLDDLEALTTAYGPLVAALGTPFELAALYTAAVQQGKPHPHLSLRTLRQAGILSSAGGGKFNWLAPGNEPSEL